VRPLAKPGKPSFLAWVTVGAPLAAWCFAVACGSSSGQPAGASCFTALDCAAGLVCIPMGSSHVCEGANGISGIETMIDGGGDAGGDDDAGPLPSLDGTQPPETGGAPDSGATTSRRDADDVSPADAAHE
jgi:hypothetical protein